MKEVGILFIFFSIPKRRVKKKRHVKKRREKRGKEGGRERDVLRDDPRYRLRELVDRGERLETCVTPAIGEHRRPTLCACVYLFIS